MSHSPRRAASSPAYGQELRAHTAALGARAQQVIEAHAVGLDYLLGELQRGGVRTKFLAVGSLAGLRGRPAR